MGNEATRKQILSAQGRTNLQLDVIHVYTIHQNKAAVLSDYKNKPFDIR